MKFNTFDFTGPFQAFQAQNMSISFSVLPQTFAIARLSPDADVPTSVLASDGFLSISRTADELSIVCSDNAAPDLVQVDRSWRAIKLHGPFSFDQTGILASFLNPIGDASIGIFAVSTFDTDYILVKSENLECALQSLEAVGHRLVD